MTHTWRLAPILSPKCTVLNINACDGGSPLSRWVYISFPPTGFPFFTLTQDALRVCLLLKTAAQCPIVLDVRKLQLPASNAWNVISQISSTSVLKRVVLSAVFSHVLRDAAVKSRISFSTWSTINFTAVHSTFLATKSKFISGKKKPCFLPLTLPQVQLSSEKGKL